MSAVDVDLAILGAGCAGLSLARLLAATGDRAPRTVALDARPAYADDRTWCFWRVEPSGFDDVAAASWPQALVRAPGRAPAVLDCRRHPYLMLRAADVYARATAEIAASERVRLALGTSVGGLARRADGAFVVETQAGALVARAVVDTRPAGPPRTGDATLWQSFLGREILCERDVFDPHAVELMDFDAPRDDRVGFAYVLPLGRRRALVEYTAFAAAPLSAADLSADLDRIEARRIGGAERAVLRVEEGRLPMGLRAPRAAPSPAYVRAGVAGGAARPSSGYAFLRIQRWARACAAAIARGEGPIGQPADPLVSRVMDSVFLRVLARAPRLGPETFARMVEGTSPDRLIRFLSDRGGPLDHLALAWSLPIGPFARAAPFGVLDAIGARSPAQAA